MENFTPLATFAVIWGLCVITPGPNFFVTAQVGLSASRQLAVLVAFGISIATAVWGTVGYTGLTVLTTQVKWSFILIQALGGTYLIYSGTKLILNSAKIRSTRDNSSEISNSLQGLIAVRTGFFTNISNPKTAIFVTSLFATTNTGTPTLLTGMILIVIMVSLSFSWYAIVALVFSSANLSNRYQQLQKPIDQLAGMVLTVFGLKVLLQPMI